MCVCVCVCVCAMKDEEHWSLDAVVVVHIEMAKVTNMHLSSSKCCECLMVVCVALFTHGNSVKIFRTGGGLWWQ